MSYVGLTDEDRKLFKSFTTADDRVQNSLKVQPNQQVGGRKLVGMQRIRGGEAQQLQIQKLNASRQPITGSLSSDKLSNITTSGRGAGRAAFLTPDELAKQNQAIASTIPEGVKETVENIKTGISESAGALKDSLKVGGASAVDAASSFKDAMGQVALYGKIASTILGALGKSKDDPGFNPNNRASNEEEQLQGVVGYV